MALHFKHGDSVQKHFKDIVEIFDGHPVIGHAINQNDRVVHPRVNLPDSL